MNKFDIEEFRERMEELIDLAVSEGPIFITLNEIPVVEVVAVADE